MKWLAATVEPGYEGALVLVNILGHTQHQPLKWRNGKFYTVGPYDLFVEEYTLADEIASWAYFPLSPKDENYHMYLRFTR